MKIYLDIRNLLRMYHSSIIISIFLRNFIGTVTRPGEALTRLYINIVYKYTLVTYNCIYIRYHLILYRLITVFISFYRSLPSNNFNYLLISDGNKGT